MLWYKAWLETRSRFLIALLGIVAICSLFVFHLDKDALSYAKPDYYNDVFFADHSMLVVMWVMAVVLMMMGGLLREEALGTSTFTLALPVSRTRLIIVRIGLGLVQAVVLAIVPWIAMYWVGRIFGAHSISQVFFYLVLLLSGGLLFFAIAVLASCFVRGEYTAPLLSFGTVIATALALTTPSLRPYNPWLFMLGSGYLNHQTNLLIWPIPWLQAATYISLAFLLLVISVKIIQKREF
jgi:ABC-2 type transport system permease protein